MGNNTGPSQEGPVPLCLSSCGYGGFSTPSRANEKLRTAGVSPTEISRVSQYLRDIMTDFETMRNFAHYRTPLTLREFSRLFLTVSPCYSRPTLPLSDTPGMSGSATSS